MILKTLDKLVLKAFTKPFIGSFHNAFILLMQNVWKYIDDLIGKGLEWPIIFEIVVYIIPTLVPLALPLAILLASLMAFGKLGENYELTALKSSGYLYTKLCVHYSLQFSSFLQWPFSFQITSSHILI
ncbi:MAG: hypothetical protein CM15mP23_22270 [Cryomorphaceae bacterium]|nr:MAG: hypothetical protein CM15mP23_22270 [Cryomorphaceae bacterium]